MLHYIIIDQRMGPTPFITTDEVVFIYDSRALLNSKFIVGLWVVGFFFNSTKNIFNDL